MWQIVDKDYSVKISKGGEGSVKKENVGGGRGGGKDAMRIWGLGFKII